MSRKMLRNRQGQALVEYALLIAGVALICAAGVTMFGHKTTQLWDVVSAVLPGTHPDDNGPMFLGQLIETTSSANGPIQLDINAIQANSGTARLGNNVAGPAPFQGGDLDTLIVEPH